MTSSALAIAPPADGAAPEPRRWSLARRVAFRFVVVYAAAFAFWSVLDLMPESESHGIKLYNAISAMDAWVAEHVLGLDVESRFVEYNGSGDRLTDWVHLLVLVVVASVASAIWSVIDRRRPHHAHLARRLRTAARYYLCFVMLNYGLMKVFQIQFSFPWEARLVRDLGDGSPMGLLWNFMGYSPAYNVFTGGAEAVGGLLLLGRRTTTLGALVIIGVMTNVVMLNFCYDVPVKIFSVHLLVLALCLAAGDLRRLANLLVLNRATPPRDLGPTLSRCMLAAKLAVIAGIVLTNLYVGWDLSRELGDSKPPLAGVWEVSSMRRNGIELPALGPDAHRWRRLVISQWGTIVESVD